MPSPPKRSLSGPVRSILVLTKHRFMGDTIVAVPLLRAVRRVYPEARVRLLTGEMAATALEGLRFVDEVMAYDPRTTERSAVGSARLSASLLRRMIALRVTDRPDLCLVADRSFRAAVAACLCGGRIRAGFDSEGRGCLLTHPVVYDQDRHEAECCLDILRAVAPEGVDEPPYDPTPVLAVTDTERARGAQILTEYGAVGSLVTRRLPLVGIQPGASHADKRWDAAGFAAVADVLAASGAVIVLIGYGSSEAEAARAMRAAMTTPQADVVDLTGKTNLRETMGVLSHLSLFIGNDTGPNHIAAALGVPTVALFGPTPAHKWGNFGPRNRVIVAPDGDMKRIAVAEVRDAARALLAGHLGTPPHSPPVLRTEAAGLALGANR